MGNALFALVYSLFVATASIKIFNCNLIQKTATKQFNFILVLDTAASETAVPATEVNVIWNRETIELIGPIECISKPIPRNTLT